MIADPALALARQRARTRMDSSALVKRPGSTTTDENGFEVDGWTTIYADLPAWLDKGRGYRTVKVGDIEMQLASRVLKCPHDTTLLRDGDVAEFKGRFYRFVETVPVDQKKQQEFEVTEMDRPGGWS